jgi:soluble lytic murein transglycosylase-like protein
MSLPELLCAAVISLNLGGPPQQAANKNIACQHMDHIVQQSIENDLPPEIMLALIYHESRWKHTAKSTAGACGLTQVLPRYTGSSKTGVPRLTCEELFDPVVSITAGARTLSYWISTYGRGKKSVGLCGYNAGFRCKGSTPHPSGMRYSRAVLRTSKKISKRVAAIRR